MEFLINNIALVFLILISGIMLIFPKLISSNNNIISPKDAVALINNQMTVIIDVRNPEEFEKEKINNALNIPLDLLAENIDSLKKKSKRTLIIYCQKGFRSAQAVKILKKLGIEILVSIDGGLDAWHKDNLPTIMRSK